MAKTCRGCGREFTGGETFCPDDGSRLSSISQMHDLSGIDPLINTTLDGRYRILRAIGEGGMGVVYEAEHVLIEKRVAIKVLRESFTRRPDVVERFRQEAKSASRIGHPNIVDVSDFGETPNRASYIVMEMLKGEDLADILTRECALAPTRAVTIVYQVAKALAAAHKKNIIHRDLKPENIYLIEREGQPDFVKVVDFGVAKMSDIETLGGRKLTRTGMIFGTPEYMSPEHAGGKSLDHRVDIYAVGVILYELLTGRVPFEGDNFMEVLSKHGHDPVPELRSVNPGTRVSPELARAVARALEKDPERRYQSMEEMIEDLRALPELPRTSSADSHVPPTWAMSAPPPPPKTSTSPVESRARTRSAGGSARNPRTLAAVAAAVVLTGALALTLWIKGTPSGAANEEALRVTSLAPREGELAASKAASASGAARQPPAAPAVEPPALAAQQPTAAAGSTVLVTLRTLPVGARASIDGFGEVCSTTPCSFPVPRARSLTLRAQSGQLAATRSLELDENAELDLVLAPSAAKRKPRSDGARAVSASHDLKTPAAFR